jgi:hypothetical protein
MRTGILCGMSQRYAGITARGEIFCPFSAASSSRAFGLLESMRRRSELYVGQHHRDVKMGVYYATCHARHSRRSIFSRGCIGPTGESSKYDSGDG